MQAKASVGANPLAKTLLDFAVEKDAIDNVTEDLQVLQSTLDNNLRLKDVLRNTQVSAAFKQRLLAEVFAGKLSPVTLAFLGKLAEVSSVSVLPELRKEFAAMSEGRRKRVVADVTTAVPLDAALEETIKKQVSGMSGKEVSVRHRLDPSILGGVIVKYEGRVYDASVNRQLDRLRSSLGGTRK